MARDFRRLAAVHLPLIAVILSLFTMVSGVAVTSPPATSLALANYPDIAGTASSLLGLAAGKLLTSFTS